MSTELNSNKVGDLARHPSQDICPHIPQIVLKTFIIISLIIKECPDEILIKLAIVLKISKSSWNTKSKVKVKIKFAFDLANVEHFWDGHILIFCELGFTCIQLLYMYFTSWWRAFPGKNTW